MPEFQNFVIIGAGNVATHLAGRITELGGSILQIYSKSIQHAEILASAMNSNATTSLNNITQNADLYVICTPDASISNISTMLKLGEKPVVHTSGSVGLTEIKPISSNTGVLYPLQTFSKNKKTAFEGIPIFVEANNDLFINQLIEFGNRLSGKCIFLDSEHRLKLHLAAVFANNFTNYMLTQAYEILRNEHLPFSFLFPLISETLNKAIELNPDQSQTGPAIRGDKVIIGKHLNLLNSDVEKFRIYEVLSELLMLKYSS